MSCGGCLGTVRRAMCMAARGAVGIVKTVVGVGLATAEVIERRRAICRGCEIAVECVRSPGRKCWCGDPVKMAMGTAEGCGCLIEVKTQVENAVCVKGLWTSVVEGGRSQVL